MNHRDGDTGENPRDNNIEELEALQQQRFLASRATASAAAAMQTAGLMSGSGIQPPLHHSLSLYGRVPAVPTLSSGILNPLAASNIAQQILLGQRRTAGLSDISRIEMLRAGLGLQPSLSASSVALTTGLNPLHTLPASAYQRALLERSHQQPLPSIHQNDTSGPPVEASVPNAASLIDMPGARGDDNRGDGCGLPRVVFTECDQRNLSEYQCLLRQQIEFYESSQLDMKWNIQGRNKSIAQDQVGLRCKWCAHIPIHRRAPGAVYYSSSLDGLYQAAQNMAKNHFCKDCNHVPVSIKKHLTQLREFRKRAPGGKRYWAEGARAIGIYECNGGLRFKKKATPTSTMKETSES